MAKQTFTTGQVLTAAQMNSLQSNDFNQTVSVKTAAYVLVAADKGTRIEFNTSGGVTCTVNTGLFDAGDTVVIQNRGAGDVTVTAGTATVNTAGSLVISQYQSATLYFISASASILFAGASGDLTGVTSGTGISISNAGGPVPTITNSMATEIAAKGDLIVGTGSGTFDNLAVGTNGYTIVADSGETTGLKYVAGLNIVLNAQTATYTTVLADAFKLVTMSVASANNFQIPTNANVAYPVGTVINVIQIGAGQTTIQAVTSGTTTISSTGATATAPKLRAQYSAASCIKVATDTWYVVGDIA